MAGKVLIMAGIRHNTTGRPARRLERPVVLCAGSG
jgi:hypothetical protein